MKIFYTLLLVFLITSCETIENKSQEAVKKENEKLSKFLGQPESELKVVMGEPDEIIYNDKGAKFFVYIKKSMALLVRENLKIDKNKMLIGFTTKGCF